MRHKLHNLLGIILLAGCAIPAAAMSSSYYKTSSVLSTGRWIKIKVIETGIQEIPFDKLRQWGFSDPEKVVVYGYGGSYLNNDNLTMTVADDLPQQYSIINNDRILFYGENGISTVIDYQSSNYYAAPKRNFASDEGYYFLTDSREATAIQPIQFVSNALSTVTTHTCVQVFEEELTNPSNSGQHFFGRDFSEEKNFTVDFDITDINSSNLTVTAQSIWIGTNTSTQNISVKLLNQSGSSLTSQNQQILKITSGRTVFAPTAASKLSASVPANTTKISVSGSTTSTQFSYLANDYISLIYSRYNRLNNDSELRMTFTSISPYAPVAIEGADAETQIWDNNNAANVRPYQSIYDEETGTARFSYISTTPSSSYNYKAIAFNPSAKHHDVELAGPVTVQNLHALETPELLIISSDVCYEQALRLADIHRSQLHHKVAVVKQDEVFNEFSSGTPTPVAFRRLAKMFYDRNSSTFRNVLLFGAGSFDNRGLTGAVHQYKEDGALIMTYPVEDRTIMGNVTQSYTTDAYFGMLADTFSPSTLDSQSMLVNVGRIPAQSPTNAISAVNKIEYYLTHVPTTDVANRAIILADSGDQDLHLNDGISIANTIKSNQSDISVTKLYDALFSWDSTTGKSSIINSLIAKHFQFGASLFTYAGHGGAGGLMHGLSWLLNDAKVTNYDYFPLAMLGTCDTYQFDHLTLNFVEEMVYKSDGGFIGVIGAGRTVFQDRNKVLSLNVTDAYTSANESTLTGDVYRIGRNTTIDSYKGTSSTLIQGRLNTLCYNYCGDPALPLYQTDKNVVITAINGSIYDSANKYRLNSFRENKIEGYVATAGGSVNTSFNGTVILTLHEAPITRYTVNHKNGDEVGRAILTDSDVLMQATAKVENGRFSAVIYPGAITREGEGVDEDGIDRNYNRITMFAYTPDRSQLAKGATTSTVISLSENSTVTPTDTDAPVVSEFYINTPSFKDGDCVDGTFEITAVIEPDQSGLSVVSSAIGSGCYVLIDNDRRFPLYGAMMTTAEDGKTQVTVPIDMVNDGLHTATIFVCDNVGNSATYEISFTVISSPVNATLSVAERPARTEATITMSHNFPDTPTGRLIIEDNAGNLVRSIDNFSETYSWDLFGADGQAVADGVYRARAFMRSGFKFAETPEIEFIVIQGNKSN